MTRFLIYLLLLIISLPALAQVRLADKVKEKYPYLLYLPKNYSHTNKKYPLVIYLHGGGMRGNDLNKLKEYGPPKAIDEGKTLNLL